MLKECNGNVDEALETISRNRLDNIKDDGCCDLCLEMKEHEVYLLTSAIHKSHGITVAPWQIFALLIGYVGITVQREFHVLHTPWKICSTCRLKIAMKRLLYGFLAVIGGLGMAVSAFIGVISTVIIFYDPKAVTNDGYPEYYNAVGCIGILMVLILFSRLLAGFGFKGKFGTVSKRPFVLEVMGLEFYDVQDESSSEVSNSDD